MAVRVVIGDYRVGHLPRDRAKVWQPLILAFMRRYERYVACHAQIKGGFALPEGGQAFYSVKLRVPVRLAPKG